MAVLDRRGRPLRSLRLSVTDRCNLRCLYCMPEAEYTWLPRADLLDFEEIARLARLFFQAGATRLRLTGGEPLLRRDMPLLVGLLSEASPWDDLALTTNGILLAPMAHELKAAGLHRITVSLDTLDADRFHAITRAHELPRVREGLDAAAQVFPGFKIDTVVIRGVNDDEVVPLVHEAGRLGAEIRFIEYMDVGGATQWSMAHVVSRADILATLTRAFGEVEPLGQRRLGAGDAVPAAARTGGRRDRLDDRALLRDLRPQPADGGRHVVPLPLRRQRHGFARAGTRRRRRRPGAGADCGGLGGEGRSGRRGSAAARRPPRLHPGVLTQARSPPRNAYSRGMNGLVGLGRVRTVGRGGWRLVRSLSPTGRGQTAWQSGHRPDAVIRRSRIV